MATENVDQNQHVLYIAQPMFAHMHIYYTFYYHITVIRSLTARIQ